MSHGLNPRKPRRRIAGGAKQSLLPSGPPERIQKLLAQAGLGSRREIEQWIHAGRIQINGRVAGIGDRMQPTDRVTIDQRPLNVERRLGQAMRVLLYNKPSGEVVARRDPEGRPRIFERLPVLRAGRWIAVGRLDLNTQGLLLLTNDGELANRLMHPGQALVREYAVRVFGQVTDEMLAQLRDGVLLEDGLARFDSIESAGGEGVNQWYKVTVHEGRNRLVRRLWESQRVTVSRLIRLRYGPVYLPARLPRGSFHELEGDELTALCASVGMQPPAPPRQLVQDRRKPRRIR